MVPVEVVRNSAGRIGLIGSARVTHLAQPYISARRCPTTPSARGRQRQSCALESTSVAG